MADNSYVYPLTVALHDLDLRDEVSAATLFRYLEEAAVRASSHFGFTLDWYREHGHFWVIHTLKLERRCAPRYGDNLEIRTWASSLGRVRSDRNYEVRRVQDGALLGRGIANWVYLDVVKKTPTRIHPEIVSKFHKHEGPTLEPLNKVILSPEFEARFKQVTTRTARFYEADSAQHVNNAVYVDWVEEAVRDALQAMGYTLGLDGSMPLPWFYRHAFEYVRAAVPGDELTICARLTARGQCRGEWDVEISNAATHDQVLRARTTMVWVNRENRLVKWK